MNALTPQTTGDAVPAKDTHTADPVFTPRIADRRNPSDAALELADLLGSIRAMRVAALSAALDADPLDAEQRFHQGRLDALRLLDERVADRLAALTAGVR